MDADACHDITSVYTLTIGFLSVRHYPYQTSEANSVEEDEARDMHSRSGCESSASLDREHDGMERPSAQKGTWPKLSFLQLSN